MRRAVNALLVYPEFTQATYWSFKEALRLVDKHANMPPLGLITIAGMLPEHYRVSLHEANSAPLPDEKLQAADIVFASAMIAQCDSLKALVERCAHFGKPLVVGGPLITTGYADVPGATHYVIGEAEHTLPLLLEDLERNRAVKAYAQVTTEAAAEPIRAHFGGQCRILVGPRPALSHTPLPRFDLLNLKRYGSMAVQFSRGCPVGCEFCDIWKQYGRRPRLKEVNRLLQELDAIHHLGYRGPVFVVDDNFIGNKQAVKQDLLPALAVWQQARGYPFGLYTEATITLGDDEELLEGMRLAGFSMVFCGIETPDEESLRRTNKAINTGGKGETVARLLERVARIQAKGLQVTAGFIMGFDQDPQNIDDLMIDFITRADIPMAMVGLLTALPGTDLYDRLHAEGRLHRKSSGNNTHVLDEDCLNFQTRMPAEELLRKYRRVLSALYDPQLKTYFQRCDKLMDKLGRLPKFERHVTFTELKGSLYSLWHLGRTEHGRAYFKFLAKRLFKDWRSFPEAVALGLCGHHFWHITRESLSPHKPVTPRERNKAASKLSDYVTASQRKPLKT